jgi:hypothetical protein
VKVFFGGGGKDCFFVLFWLYNPQPMSFDFYSEYKNYPNLELLKIMKEPGGYQPEAVMAASRVLGERQVAAEELQLLDQSLQDLDHAVKQRKEEVERLKARVWDFFSPILQPQERVEPEKWLNILLLMIGIEYIWKLVDFTRIMIRVFSRGNFFWVDILNFFTIAYLPFIFYLLLRRRRWGWILLFADNFAALILRLSESYFFFKYHSIHHGSTISFTTPILVWAAFAFFLWRNHIVGLFGVNATTRKQTFWITLAGTLLLMEILYHI